MDVFSPAPRNTRELVSPGDVFSLALESKIASKSNGLVVKMNVKKRVQKKGAQTSEEVLSLFSFRRKM